MSNHLAVATVTATIRNLLFGVIPTDVPGANVTHVRPDRPGANGAPTLGVNVYLYEVSPNLAWRNADLPTRDVTGQLAQRPRVALDLHYLISFYGSEATLEPQRLLASVTRLLHARPVLTVAQVQQTVAANAFLTGSTLDKQEEVVRLTPHSLTLDDMYRLWSVFFQQPYVLSVAYHAAPVLVEPDVQVAPALPVRQPNLFVAPFPQMTVKRVVAQAGAERPIFPGSAVTVLGKGLFSPNLVVRVGGAEVVPTRTTDTRIELVLPAGMRAGPQGLQVSQRLQLGSPPTDHPGVESNVAAFMVSPRITMTGPNFDIAIANVQGAGTAPRNADITVGFAPACSKEQTMTLELLSGGVVRMTTRAPARVADAGSITFAVRGVAAGAYLVRVRIDGADSPFVDASNNPITPGVTIP